MRYYNCAKFIVVASLVLELVCVCVGGGGGVKMTPLKGTSVSENTLGF